MRPARQAVTALNAAPSALASVLAVALVALLLAACTTGKPAGSGPSAGARRPGAGPALRRAIGLARGGRGPVGVFIIGPGGFRGALVALPGGGGPAGGSGRPKISVPPIPPASSAAAVALPLDSYEEVSVQEQDALAAAGDLLTQRCMTAAGFSYPVAAEPGGGEANVQSFEYGYGINNLAQAETYGYKQPAQNGPGLSPALLALPGFLGQQNKHGAAWTSALLGFVPGARARAPQHQGCLQTTDTELYGRLGGDPNPDPVPPIAIESAQWTQSDPRILAVQRAWSACMARSGLTLQVPGAGGGPQLAAHADPGRDRRRGRGCAVQDEDELREHLADRRGGLSAGPDQPEPDLAVPAAGQLRCAAAARRGTAAAPRRRDPARQPGTGRPPAPQPVAVTPDSARPAAAADRGAQRNPGTRVRAAGAGRVRGGRPARRR